MAFAAALTRPLVLGASEARTRTHGTESRRMSDRLTIAAPGVSAAIALLGAELSSLTGAGGAALRPFGTPPSRASGITRT